MKQYNCVVVGVPAKIICSTTEYAKKMKEKMPSDWNVDEYKRNKKSYLIKNVPEPK